MPIGKVGRRRQRVSLKVFNRKLAIANRQFRHSARSATTGSTFAARRAGSHAARPVISSSTSAMVTADARVARFYRDRLVELLRADPELALAMIAGMSRRLREPLRFGPPPARIRSAAICIRQQVTYSIGAWPSTA